MTMRARGIFFSRHYAASSSLNPNLATLSFLFSSLRRRTRRKTSGLGGCCSLCKIRQVAGDGSSVLKYGCQLIFIALCLSFSLSLSPRKDSNCITIPVKRGVTSSGGFRAPGTLSVITFLRYTSGLIENKITC